MRLWNENLCRKESIADDSQVPQISLKEARERHIQAKLSLANGVNPSEEKKLKKQEISRNVEIQKRAFEEVARDWFESQHAGNYERTKKSTLQRMKRICYFSLVYTV